MIYNGSKFALPKLKQAQITLPISLWDFQYALRELPKYAFKTWMCLLVEYSQGNQEISEELLKEDYDLTLEDFNRGIKKLYKEQYLFLDQDTKEILLMPDSRLEDYIREYYNIV